jgi:hypothetical protein
VTDKSNPQEEDKVEDLFAKATTNIDVVKPVSSFIRTGKQWDFTHKDVIGSLLVLHRAKEITTKYGQAYLVDADYEGKQVTILMGGQVLIQQCEDLMPHLPALAVIRKPARAYTLTDPTEDEIAEYTKKYRS